MTLFQNRARPIIVDEPAHFDFPDSQLVSASQFYEKRYQYWLEKLGSGLIWTGRPGSIVLFLTRSIGIADCPKVSEV